MSVSSFDFDRVIDRRSSDSLKWNKYGDAVLPMWVADMDFVAPPPVLEALKKRLDHGCFGYGRVPGSLLDVVVAYAEREYGWHIEPEWIVWLPGLVPGINVACRAVDGDVLTCSPVYPPFFSAPPLSGRALVRVPLALADGRWQFDFAALEAAITPQTQLLLLCHPHNPVGRAWRSDELATLAAFCKRHDLVVCSDEIHCDLVLETGLRHQPFASLNEDTAARTITLMAPSKTYNVPGLACAFAVVADPALRRRFVGATRGILPDVNVFGLIAAEAAFRDGAEWRAALLDVLRRNRDRVEKAVAGMPGLAMTHVEATYLAWIDARGLGVEDPAALFMQAGVGLSNGADFGSPGWVRLNFGCPISTLDEGLARMAAACSSRRP